MGMRVVRGRRTSSGRSQARSIWRDMATVDFKFFEIACK